jgi:ferredoxin--NADP+ reductase
VLDPDELAATDAVDHAIAAFASASVRDVVIVGRRGPAQAAFTNPELRELGALALADVVVDPTELELDPASADWLESGGASPTAVRNVAMLRELAARPPTGASHRIDLRFCRSPVEVLGDGEGPVTGLRVVRNRLEPDARGGVRALATDEQEVIPCGLVIRSIGYRGRRLPGVPFDERRGLIRNDGGRVCEEDGTPRTGEYAVGWIKRGPSGVIGTNKKCAFDTVGRLLEDLSRGRLNEPPALDGAAVEPWLRTRVPALVTWHGWQAIDEHERRLGTPEGRPRVKLVRVPEMLAVAGSKAA